MEESHKHLTKREEEIMKQIIIIIMVLFTLCLAGGMYNTLAQLDNVEPETADHAYMNPFPYEMPNVVVDPMLGIPLY
jgi:flagellar basal body-associated protein FliL